MYTMAIESNKNTKTVNHCNFWLNLTRDSSRRVVSTNCDIWKTNQLNYLVIFRKLIRIDLRIQTEFVTWSHWRSTSIRPPLLGKWLPPFAALLSFIEPAYAPMLHFSLCCSTEPLLFCVFWNGGFRYWKNYLKNY